MELKELTLADMEMVKQLFYLYLVRSHGMMIGLMRNN